jgi:predicted lipoprotein with Yx(FWY)xxD motif
MAPEDAKPTGEFTVIVRDDGKKQWAFKGKPLYYWAKDTKPGDKTGDGFNKVWQVAKP